MDGVEIRKAVMTVTDITEARKILQVAEFKLKSVIRAKFRRTMAVEFDHLGRTIQGHVERVNIKTLTIDVPHEQSWRVPPEQVRLIH